jgi:hypothetical protein
MLADNNCLTIFLLRVHAVFVHTNIVIIKLIARKAISGAYAAVISTNVNVIAIQEVAISRAWISSESAPGFFDDQTSELYGHRG